MFKKYTDFNQIIEDINSGLSVAYDRGVVVQVALESQSIPVSEQKTPITIFVKNPDTYFDNTQRYVYSEVEFKELTFTNYFQGISYYLSLPGNTLAGWNLLPTIEKEGFQETALTLEFKARWDKTWNIPINSSPILEMSVAESSAPDVDAIITNSDVVDFISANDTVLTPKRKIFKIKNLGIDNLVLNSPTAPVLLTSSGTAFRIINQPSPIIIPTNVEVSFEVEYDPNQGTDESASLLIQNNDLNQENFVIPLEGFVIFGEAELTMVEPIELSFISETLAEVVEVIKINNTEIGDMQVTDAEITGSSEFVLVDNIIGQSIEGMSDIDLAIRYVPVGPSVVAEATLVLTFNSELTPTKSITLKGVSF